MPAASEPPLATPAHVRLALAALREVCERHEDLHTFEEPPGDDIDRMLAVVEAKRPPTSAEMRTMVSMQELFARQMGDTSIALEARMSHVLGWLYGTLRTRWQHLLHGDHDATHCAEALGDVRTAVAIAQTLSESIERLRTP